MASKILNPIRDEVLGLTDAVDAMRLLSAIDLASSSSTLLTSPASAMRFNSDVIAANTSAVLGPDRRAIVAEPQ